MNWSWRGLAFWARPKKGEGAQQELFPSREALAREDAGRELLAEQGHEDGGPLWRHVLDIFYSWVLFSLCQTVLGICLVPFLSLVTIAVLALLGLLLWGLSGPALDAFVNLWGSRMVVSLYVASNLGYIGYMLGDLFLSRRRLYLELLLGARHALAGNKYYERLDKMATEKIRGLVATETSSLNNLKTELPERIADLEENHYPHEDGVPCASCKASVEVTEAHVALLAYERSLEDAGRDLLARFRGVTSQMAESEQRQIAAQKTQEEVAHQIRREVEQELLPASSKG